MLNIWYMFTHVKHRHHYENIKLLYPQKRKKKQTKLTFNADSFKIIKLLIKKFSNRVELFKYEIFFYLISNY
jgi:hypothetical protein